MSFSLIRGIASLLRSRIFWVTFGVVALCWMIWYLGPAIPFGKPAVYPFESVAYRIALIALILLIALIRLMIVRWRAGRMNERIANMLRSSLAASASEDKEKAAILNERFNEALNILRKARFESDRPSFWGRIARRGRYVYELPWYVIIGAPGVGKTTALLNSGLSFPLSSQVGASAIRGAGGTRNCDWWFTNEAVFIDTAGRYTTHESDAQSDRAEWRSFLSLLKKNRPRQPINGMLVMLSVAELLGQSREERRKHAATLRQRLDELRSDLGMSFPVYLLINKCDLMLGFDEYFSALDRSGRAQVWGATLPLSPTGKYQFDLKQIAAEFSLLQTRISNGLADVLQAESSLSRRELIYAFPQQFDALTQVLGEMMPELLDTSRFSESPFLRGIYFTSATQEGTPFDRVIHVLGQGFDVKPPQKAAAVGEGKAYFLQELLARVVFGEAHIASMDRRAERRSHILHVAGYAFSVLALVGAVLAWGRSYSNNKEYLADVGQKADALGKKLPKLPAVIESGRNLGSLLPILDETGSLLDGIKDAQAGQTFGVDNPPLWWQFGLYQGTDLKPKVWGARGGLYRRLLNERLAPMLAVDIENSLKTDGKDDMEHAYEALKAYLMLFEKGRMNDAEFIRFAKAFWGPGFSQNQMKSLERHIKALRTENILPPAKAVDQGLIESTRARLKKNDVAVFVHSRVKRNLRDRLPLPDVNYEPEWPLIINHNATGIAIDPLYTRKGYLEWEQERENSLKDIEKSESLWVLNIDKNTPGLKVDVNRLSRAVDEMYANAYIAIWQKHLNSVGVAARKNSAEASEIIRRLSGDGSPDSSPLYRFLFKVVEETELVRETDKNDAEPVAGGSIRPVRLVPVQPLDDIPAMRVNRYFADLRKFVKGSNGTGNDALILGELKRLNKIADLLLQASEVPRGGAAPAPGEITSLKGFASAMATMPKGFRDVARPIVEESRSTIEAITKKKETDDLRIAVTQPCTKAISGRYPFSPGSASDVTEGAFADIFGPGGKIDQFYQQQGVSVEHNSNFRDARVIKDVFFRNGSNPTMEFRITPLELDANAQSVTLQLGGETIRYSHGAQVTTAITWPSRNDRVRVAMTPPTDNGVNEINLHGFWALHRLFSNAAQSGPDPNIFRVTVNVGGRRATFEVRSTGVKNPFGMPELQRFRCPQTVPRG